MEQLQHPRCRAGIEVRVCQVAVRSEADGSHVVPAERATRERGRRGGVLRVEHPPAVVERTLVVGATVGVGARHRYQLQRVVRGAWPSIIAAQRAARTARTAHRGVAEGPLLMRQAVAQRVRPAQCARSVVGKSSEALLPDDVEAGLCRDVVDAPAKREPRWPHTRMAA
eukprot:5702632-Prymnesium_polylepis.1